MGCGQWFKNFLGDTSITEAERHILNAVSVFCNMSEKSVLAEVIDRYSTGEINNTCMLLDSMTKRGLVVWTNRESTNPMENTYVLSLRGTEAIKNKRRK